jgi:quinol monooxygenase YgiN
MAAPSETAYTRLHETVRVSEPYGMHVRFTATSGQSDALEAILLEAAAGAEEEDACRLYMVSRSLTDAETVLVTEAWTSREAHDASLKDERAQALIRRALPLLAGLPEATELRPAGGKGL